MPIRQPAASRIRYRGVEQACIAAIGSSPEPLYFRDIHAAAESLPGIDVPYSSVKNAVIRLAGAADKPFARARHGVYWTIEVEPRA